jgi:hypothetical protein
MKIRSEKSKKKLLHTKMLQLWKKQLNQERLLLRHWQHRLKERELLVNRIAKIMGKAPQFHKCFLIDKFKEDKVD